MQEALRSRLLADATVSGLVGNRVDWGLRPQAKSLPAISLTLIPTPRDYMMSGAQETQHYRVQVDCWADSYKDAHTLRSAVIAELEPANASFFGSFLERSADMPERTDTSIIHRAMLEFRITPIPA